MELEDVLTEIKNLVEGRLQPEEWVAWWEKHAADAKKVLKPGHFTRLKVRGEEAELRTPRGAMSAAGASSHGARHVLDAYEVSYQHDPKIEQRSVQIGNEEVEKCEIDQQKQLEDTRRLLKPLKAVAPAVHDFLKKNDVDFQIAAKGASAEELEKVAKGLGVELSAALTEFFAAVEWFQVEGLSLRLSDLRWHPVQGGQRYICFGEYFLKSDGDQLLFEPGGKEPKAVLYYEHGEGESGVSEHSKNFRQFIERVVPEYLKVLSGP